MTHVRAALYYPQSNGKLERLNKTIKSEAIRVSNPASLEEARRIVERFVAHYNNERLHSAFGFATPADMASGNAPAIWKARDEKLHAARERRRQRRANPTSEPTNSTGAAA